MYKYFNANIYVKYFIKIWFNFDAHVLWNWSTMLCVPPVFTEASRVLIDLWLWGPRPQEPPAVTYGWGLKLTSTHNIGHSDGLYLIVR